MKNINGAFVEFDKDETGFLSMRHRQYKVGDEVLVQIKKEATEEKTSDAIRPDRINREISCADFR